MKKVQYSITKKGKSGSKQSGVGFLIDNTLFVALNGKSAYVKAFEDCLTYCKEIVGEKNVFKGEYLEYVTLPLEDEKGKITEKEIQLSYYIWFRIIN